MYAQGRNGMGEIDWNSLLQNAVSAYGTVSAVKTQKEIMELQAQQQSQQQNPFLYYGNSPAYSGTYSSVPQTSSLSNMMPFLLIGGLALAAFFILKK